MIPQFSICLLDRSWKSWLMKTVLNFKTTFFGHICSRYGHMMKFRESQFSWFSEQTHRHWVVMVWGWDDGQNPAIDSFSICYQEYALSTFQKQKKRYAKSTWLYVLYYWRSSDLCVHIICVTPCRQNELHIICPIRAVASGPSLLL